MDLVMGNVHASFAGGIRPREQAEEEDFCREVGLCFPAIGRAVPLREFLIESHRLALVESAHPDDKINGSWLPIAPDIAVLVTAFPDREYLLAIDKNRTRVPETINAASNSLSRTVGARSEALVRRLLTT